MKSSIVKTVLIGFCMFATDYICGRLPLPEHRRRSCDPSSWVAGTGFSQTSSEHSGLQLTKSCLGIEALRLFGIREPASQATKRLAHLSWPLWRARLTASKPHNRQNANQRRERPSPEVSGIQGPNITEQRHSQPKMGTVKSDLAGFCFYPRGLCAHPSA